MRDNEFIIIHRQDINRNVWDRFVDLSDEAWLWHRYDFQDTLCRWPNRQDMSFAVVNPHQGNKLVAIVPVHIISYGIFRWMGLNYFDSFGGPACASGLDPRYKRKLLSFIVGKMVEWANANHAYEITVELPPMAPAFCGDRCPVVNPLLKLGFENTLSQTWVVDLQQEKEKIWENMEARTRGAIRKAINQKILVRQAIATDVDDYYTLHCETYRRTGATPHPKEYFEAIWSNFHAKGFSRIFIAEKEGKIIAADNFGVYKTSSIYWTGASNRVGLSTQANSLLQWTAMQWMKENNIKFYETGEAFPHVTDGKLKGLNDFKKSFGGDLYPFYRGRMVINKKMFEIMNIIKRMR